MSTGMKILSLTLVVGVLATIALVFPRSTGFDLTGLRDSLRPMEVQLASETMNASEGDAMLPDVPQKVVSATNQARAQQFLEAATRDYYQGSFEEASRRLERAKSHNPGCFEVFRLSGQIAYETGRYRKAFNDWARASQLPNQDRTLQRDLDVLKRLLRHGRTEIDLLRRQLFRNPEDRLVSARLNELENLFSGNE